MRSFRVGFLHVKIPFSRNPRKEMAWYLYPALILAGFIAGLINTLAGSGSILTLPLLMYMGLPPTVANATNRVSIILQNSTATITFVGNKLLDTRKAWQLGLPAILGSGIGAFIALSIDEAVMRTVIGVVMILMAVLLLLNSDQWLQERVNLILNPMKWWHLVVMFLVGIYGGFIQLGVGIILLVFLVMGTGLDIKHSNAMKVAVTFMLNIVAVIVFQGQGQINWQLGLVVAMGSIAGAWVGARYAIHWKTRWIYRLLILVIVITAMDLLGVLSWIGGLLTGQALG